MVDSEVSSSPITGLSRTSRRIQAGAQWPSADRLEDSGAWREPWKRRRCLIPASFFYEWEPLTKEEEKKKLSKPWAISLSDNALFAFGGIWDQWKDKDTGNGFESFSIITTEPNELLEPFHNRSPLIIEPKDYERWLAPSEPSHLPIDLLRTHPADGMRAWRVAKLQSNGPQLYGTLGQRRGLRRE
jgi:putative SOS response-associated peptidase YedK